MTEQRHIVRRQVLEFRVAGTSESFALQQEMARIYNEAIVPLLDEYLSAYSSPDAIDKIERLELDLGTLDRNDLYGSFVRNAEAQLAAQLPEIIALLDRRRTNDRQIAFLARSEKNTGTSATNGALPEHGSAAPNSTAQYVFDPGETASRPASGAPAETAYDHSSTTELLAYYLQTGRFPWWAREIGSAVLERTFLQLLETQPEALAALLRKLLRQPVATKRLIVSFDDRVLHRLPAAFLPKNTATAAKKLLTAWKSLPAARTSVSEQRIAVWAAVLSRVFSTGSRAEGIPNTLLQELRTENLPPAEKLLVLLQALVVVFNLGMVEAQLKTALSAMKNARKAAATRKGTKKIAMERTVQQLQADAAAAVHRLLQEITAVPAGEKQLTRVAANTEKHYDVFSESDRIYINNAGLVLLLKLVPTYFERVGLLNEQRQWKTDSCRAKACVLLDFLVTGNDKTPPLEADLMLNKIVCGVPLHEPLETRFKLTKEERSLGENLLKSVIGYWPKIGEQSPDGFRGNFLVRPGIISERDGNWLVQVEKRPYDVLLATFPWSLSMNKFPWSPSLIAVEWPY